MSDELKAKGSKPCHHPSPITHHPKAGTVLACDFGTRRIGIAVGDFETRLAHPLASIAGANNRARFAAIERIVAEWRPTLFVVGVPSRVDGSEHPVGKLARRFAQKLSGCFGIPAELVDEHLTSFEAEHDLRAAGARGARLKSRLDSVAAQRILESYFASAK
ncbi:MAG: Holliday junction resolvase RuvX [Betaproteobacteria bacterium]|nr:Holliday junction resolvase RuvX [Betaproteobacteria bacterium]MDH3437228.1 Holliday junction resolvase RuvX [Betaproteobacteria bacterium]